MFRPRERGGTGQRNQGGFSLIEVVVAVVVLVMVLVALLPQLVVGIRATSEAKNATQAKGVLQQQLEKMRSMPYRVAPARGEFKDLLDTYYQNLDSPAGALPTPGCKPNGIWANPDTSWSGFVGTGTGETRCSYEPASGAFYRRVNPPQTVAGLGSFILVVDTAFLDSAVPPVAIDPSQAGRRVGARYDSFPAATGESDTPESLQVGVWATLVYPSSSAMKPVTTYTQISARNPVESSMEVAATVKTIRVSSYTSTSPDSLIVLDAGAVAQSGALFTGSTVNMTAKAASASSGAGALVEGAQATLSAPGSTPSFPPEVTWGKLNDSCLFACFGESNIGGAWVSAANGLPLSGKPADPVQVGLTSVFPGTGYGESKYAGLWFNNGPDSPSTVPDRGLRANQPMVTLDGRAQPVQSVQSGCTNPTLAGSQNFVSASGYLITEPVSLQARAVTSCVTARSAPILLFPTDWAPDGVIRVTLYQSSLQCRVQRTAAGARSAEATASYRATVEYWNGSLWRPAGSVTESLVEPLVDLNTSVGHGDLKLSDFIQSWQLSTSADVARNSVTTATSVRANVPGVVSISSQPTRAADPNSVVLVTVGTFTCAAMDIR